MSQAKRVLVLGARGMLGHDLLDMLSCRYQVEGADIGELDITDGHRTERFIRACRPAVVINAAARTDVDGCESDRAGAFAVNARGAENIAKACASAGSRLIHMSTDYVFDGRAGRPYREDDRPNPESVYGKSKLEGEEAVRKHLPDHLILRTSWLFGAHGKNFVDTILRAAAGTSVLRVVGDQQGCPTYTRDLAEGIGKLMPMDYRGTVNVTNSGIVSWCEYARAIIELAGLIGVRVEEITSAELRRPAPRPPCSALDGSRYARLTGAPMRNWREAVGEYIKSRIGVGRGA